MASYGCSQQACPCLADYIDTLLFDNGNRTGDNLAAPGPDRSPPVRDETYPAQAKHPDRYPTTPMPAPA